jgi:hypothetical protein
VSCIGGGHLIKIIGDHRRHLRLPFHHRPILQVQMSYTIMLLSLRGIRIEKCYDFFISLSQPIHL